MKTVEKNVLVLHSAEQMFELVDRAEDYPQFLPWYSKTEIIERKGNSSRRVCLWIICACSNRLPRTTTRCSRARNPHGFARGAV